MARQCCGWLGKVDNCQCAVLVSYISSARRCLGNSQLYLPGEWFSQGRCQQWHRWLIHRQTRFITEPEIAVRLVRRISAERGLRLRWMRRDAFLGTQLQWLEQLPEGVWPMAQVNNDTHVLPKRPKLQNRGYRSRGRKPSRHRPKEPGVVARDLIECKDLPSRPETVFTGSKGPVVSDLLTIRVPLVREGEVKGPF